MEIVKTTNIISIKNIIITSKKCLQLIELYNYFGENKELNCENFNEILKNILQNNNHNIFLYLDNSDNILGALTLLIEQKFIHNGKCVAHIEDFVVKQEFRSQNIGKDLMNSKLVNYYRNYGFVNKGIYMGCYF